MNHLENHIARVIADHRLLPYGTERPVLVALSGGADSVALLRLLLALGYTCQAAHCNFRLRGDESERDEQFVRRLCHDLGVTLHVQAFDTAGFATGHKLSIEMAARQLRYDWFDRLIAESGCQAVAVAHHRDDNVETLLLNLFRGSGLHGLTGMDYHNGHIVRPLLDVTRQQLLDYLTACRQDYVTDSTNLQSDVLRNRIRLQLLPLVEDIYPGATENLARSAYYLSEAEKVYNAEISREKDACIGGLAPVCEVHEVHGDCPLCAFPLSALTTSPSPLCLLHELLSPLGFNRIQIEQILVSLDGESGREFTSPTHILVIDRQSIIVEPLREPMKPLVIPEPGIYRLDETAKIRVELPDGDTDISRDPHVATLDATRIQFPLTVRPVQQGDRFQPYGMQGQKLVSDFLTDLKLNTLEKRRQLVVTDATGTILWLVDRRIDHRYRMTPDTAAVLRITFTSIS